MKRTMMALLATALLIGTASSVHAAPPYDIDKLKAPIYGGETKGSIYVLRIFRGIVKNVETDTKYGIYDRFVSGTMTAEEKKFLATFPKTEQVKFMHDMKHVASIKPRLYLYGRTGEKAWANKMAVAEGKEKPFQFIEREYGEEAYGWIVANKPALDAKFSAYVEGERDKLRAGLLKSDHSNSEILRIPTYSAYVESMGVSKLEAVRKRKKSVRDKATVEYFKYLLITDRRLYFEQSRPSRVPSVSEIRR